MNGTAAYAQLVSSLADLEPRHGWSADDLPPLSNADIRAICAMREQRVLDNLDMGDVVRALAAGSDTVGLVLDALHRACREALFLDVERECETRAEHERIELDRLDHARLAGYRIEP